MFGFALKKTFFDLWDNLYFAIAVNVGFTVGVLGVSSLSFLFQGWGTLGFLLFVPLPFVAAALLGGLATFWARDVAVEGTARFSDFPSRWAASWKTSLAFCALWLVLAGGLLFGVPFYNSVNNVLGFGFGVLIAWAAFFAAGLGLYYPGLNAQVEPQVGKLLRKSFLLFLANPGLTLLMALVFVVCVALSVVTLGFFPGIFGISIWLQVCFKFLLAKYEWLEANPEADRKAVPWAVIVAEDMDKVGPRSLRNLIFPWKD